MTVDADGCDPSAELFGWSGRDSKTRAGAGSANEQLQITGRRSRRAAGRKKGTPNKITAALREEVARTGKSALQVMMDNMRVA